MLGAIDSVTYRAVATVCYGADLRIDFAGPRHPLDGRGPLDAAVFDEEIRCSRLRRALAASVFHEAFEGRPQRSLLFGRVPAGLCERHDQLISEIALLC